MFGLSPSDGYKKKTTNLLEPTAALRIALCLFCLIFVFLGGSYTGYILGLGKAFNGLNRFDDINYDDNDIYPSIADHTPLTEDNIAKFAPKWMFHNAEGGGYPMAPQIFYDYITTGIAGDGDSDGKGHCVEGKLDGNRFCENTDFSNIYSGYVPTLYAVTYCSTRIRIKFFIAYGFQHSCDTCFGEGAHQGGFESVTIVLTDDGSDVYGAYFKQHKGYHFRTKDRINMDGTHVMAYVGQWAHGTYHNGGEDLIDATYYGDPRNNDKTWISTKSQLLNITGIREYTFGGTTPPTWNGEVQTWMRVSSETEYSNSADESRQTYGSEFFKKITKEKDNIDQVCEDVLDACDGQDTTTEEGCKKAVCFDGVEYEDYIKDKPWRCKLGCGGDRWSATSNDVCVKKKSGFIVDTKSRTNYGRDNQPQVI